MVFVIGLGGVTCSGKTTMSDQLSKYLSSQYNNVRVIDLDSYARDENDPKHIHLPELNHKDWESLTSLHVDRFISDIKSIINNNHNNVLIIEGFLIYSIDELKSIFNLSYYFDLNFDECRKRRNRRTYNPPDPPNYFDKHVWPSYLIAKKQAFDQIENLTQIDSTQPLDEIFQRIINDVNIIIKNERNSSFAPQ
jgi:nicotinamide/nicotinate riboside kinase